MGLMSVTDTKKTTVLQIAEALMACPSVSPKDVGCQDIIAEFLGPLGFKIEKFQFGQASALLAWHGKGAPRLVLAGHTDVVEPGVEKDWNSPPFKPTINDGYLFGRGAVDMKGGIAAMVAAAKEFVHVHPNHKGSLVVLATSDEELDSTYGAVPMTEKLKERGEYPAMFITGEPSSSKNLADTIRVGRRGSFHGCLRMKGIQGHVASPPKSIVNPIHRSMAPLADMAKETWDNGNDHFPPTSFQISNIRSGVGADNVVPPVLEAEFNWRFCTEITPEIIKKRVYAIFEKYGLHQGADYEIDWRLSGEPFLTAHGELLMAIQKAIKELRNIDPELSTGGGTSDGRFFAKLPQAQVIELGPINATAHRINECVLIDDLIGLQAIYYRIIEILLS